MATNPYSYGSLGQRWTVGEPTSKSLLDVSRVKADASRWTLEQLLGDPDDTANFALTATSFSGNVTGGTISGTTGLYTSTLATSAGDIGVGTHSPTGLGARTVNIKAVSSAGADLTIEADNGNNFGVFFSGATASDPFSIFSNTGFKFAIASDKNATGFDEALRIKSDGNVGFNETSPDTIIHASQGGEPPAEGMLILEANSSSRQLRIQPPTNADNGFFDARGGNMTFLDDGTEIFRYNASTISTSSGINVGIGTDSPACRAHIRESTLSGFTPDGNTNLAVEENSTSMIEIAGADSGILFSDATAWAGRIFYTHSNDQMAFATGQSNKMWLTSTGNLGLSESSPAARLHIMGSDGDPSASHSGSAQLILENDANTFLEIATGAHYAGLSFSDGTATRGAVAYDHGTGLGGGADSMHFQTGGTLRAVINSSGNFGIGSLSPTYKLVVSNGGAAGYEFNVGGLNGGVNTVVYNRSTSAYVDSAHFALNYYIFTGSTPAEVLRATSAGEVWIKNTSDQGSYNLQVGGTGVWGAGAYVNGSDKRLKKSIATYTDNALDLVNQMRPVTFEYVEGYSDDRATQVGFIAQDLQEVLQGKEYLDGIVKDDAEHLNVAYQSLIPVLTKAIQELTARIEALEAA